MRLRNLYEVQIQPGERKGFSLRLKKLEDLQIKIADMQNTILNLKGTAVPDVLKKQMDDLINSATMEKEKLYSEFGATESKLTSTNGIPGNVLKLLKGIEKNSSIIMNAYRQTGAFLYRGIRSNDDALYGRPFDERRAKDSNAVFSDALNRALADAGFTARRDNTSFTSGNYDHASNYGSSVYIFFPRDGFSFHYSKSIRDLVMGTDKIHLLLDQDLLRDMKKVLSDNWAELNQYFTSISSPSEFMSGYTYEGDIRSIQSAVAAGKLPPEFAKYKTFYDFVDPTKVISNMEYDQTDLDAAIKSKHEVMITGPYYALLANKYSDHIKEYLKMTSKDAVDITPDTESEKSKLDSKINELLGQQPDGFLIGDWIEHKYEEDLKGEIINNFYTNDFLLVKTYEGKLELVKNSNAKKIKTPDIPKYNVGDKLYLKTSGSSYAYLNNKYGVVTGYEYPIVHITYSGSYTLSIPAILTEPAPKYDTNQPQIGDTVKITNGDMDGEYGTITAVSYYKDVDVDFGNGETDSFSKGNYEVVDPDTKPAPSESLKFDVGQYVEISSPGTWAGFVGIVADTGTFKSSISIMGGNENSGLPNTAIPNKRLSVITQEEFENRKIGYKDTVMITAGKDNGKTGKVSYFYSNGTVELVLDSGGYADVKFGDLKIVSKTDQDATDDLEDEDLVDLDNIVDADFEDLYDTPVKKPEPKDDGFDADALPFMVGDPANASNPKVKNPKWTISKITSKNITLKNNTTNKEIEVSYDKFYKANPDYAPAKDSKFKVGDKVVVTKGNFEGFEGTISSGINASNEYMVTIVMYGKDTTVPFDENYLGLIKNESTKNQDQLLKDLIKKGKDTGSVTYAELNNLLPPEKVTSDEVEKIINQFIEMGIEIVDESGLTAPSGDTPEQLVATMSEPERKQGLIEIFKDPAAKILIKNAVDSKYVSSEIVIVLFTTIGYDKYIEFVKPYLELKGVTFG